MTRNGSVDPPEVRTVEWYGARIDVVDADAVLGGDVTGSVLRSDAHPTPVRGIDLTVTRAREAGRMLRLHGTVRLGGLWWVTPRLTRELRAAALPVAAAVLLGNIRAPIAAATMGIAALRARQQQQADEQRGEDPGLLTTLASPDFGSELPLTHGVARHGTQRSVSTSVEVTDPTADDLVAFAKALLDLARQLAGRPDDDAFFAGRTYVLGPEPDGGPAEAPTGLDTLGGLDDVVAQLRQVALSFRHPEVMERWGARRPRGILLYGPPGTGKTTLAHALATEVGAEVREIRVPDILNMWVGSSERNLKKVFSDARQVTRPTLLLFDEFESIISYTGQARDAASQMNNALAGLFKQEMSTLVDDNPMVLVVATTNFPDRVDESLVRAGRFDIKMEVPRPGTAARADIIRTLLRTLVTRHGTTTFRLLADDIDPDELAALTPGMTGADLDEVLRRVQMAKALAEASGDGPVTPITQADLRAVIATLPGQRIQGPGL